MLLHHQPLLGDLLNPSCWGVYLPGGVVGNFMLICHPWLVIHRSYSCWCHNLPENAESTRINSNASSTGNVMINIDKPCDSVFPQIFRYQSHVLRGTNPHPDSARRSLLLSPCELRLRLKETSLRETPNLSPNKSSLGRPNMLWPCRCIYYNIYILYYIYYTIYSKYLETHLYDINIY